MMINSKEFTVKAHDIKPGYTRVSTILSPFSGLNSIDKKVLKNAADRGTITHLAIDDIINFRLSDIPSEIERCNMVDFDYELELINNMIESFNIWAVGKKFLANVPRLYDDEFMMTGEIDILYQSDNGPVLVDFKTSASESKTWPMQGTAYAHMLKKDHEIAGIEFVKLNRKGGAPANYFYKYDMETFKSVFETYNYFYKDYKPQVELDYI
jgi:hypothetical protein